MRVFLPLALVLVFAAAARAQPPATAKEAVALPQGGGWLTLESRALKWIDGAGVERASLPVRGKLLSVRPDPASGPGAWVATLLDSNSSQPLLLRGVPAQGTQPAQLQTLAALPPTRLDIDALCMHRDAQGLLQLFVIGADGRAEQWLLHATGNRLIRERALPPGATACTVDDARGRLYVSEEALGVWQIDIATEGATARKLIAQRAPTGRLRGEIGPLALLPDGLAVGDGRRVQRLTETVRGAWPLRTLPGGNGGNGSDGGNAGKIDSLAASGNTLHWLADGAKAWQSRTLSSLQTARGAAPLPIVLPRAQTEPMATLGDAADDPAIWVHPQRPQDSRVLGTNKKQGLAVYALDGRQTQFLPVGRLNNVDLRQGVRAGGQTLDIAVATHRDLPGLVVFDIDADGSVAEAGRIALPLKGIYGMCSGLTPAGDLDVYANDSDGSVLHLRLALAGAQWTARELRRFKLKSQPEGCVVDEAAERVFIGEEDVAVWALSARADQAPVLTPVIRAGGLLRADIEGIALHRTPQAAYLVVSSQGNDSYVVLDAAPPWRVRGAFRIGIDAERGIDGTSETDGLDVTSRPLGPDYPRGMLVVQDGHKTMPMGPQNFKLVSWQDIEAALGLR